ncbi:MAG: hypothetical protein KJO64_03965 [Bacteroidia bacterium]|nr:hypothetical protein [Bacteroidia bacterium]NNC84792.1 hypothetical protein [Bacteroidia bacterium]
MKNIIKSISIITLLLVGTSAMAQEKKQKKIQTAEFEVSGLCNMCKKRIEEAALIKGVRLAEWDKFNQEIKVIYSTKQTDLEKIKMSISAVGYDTDSVKGDDEAYAKLPECCKYRGELEVH